MMPTVSALDIFSGRFGEKDVVWRGTAEGLGAARDRMLQFAANQPGAYFVFSSDSQLIVAAVDTSDVTHAPKSPTAKSAAQRPAQKPLTLTHVNGILCTSAASLQVGGDYGREVRHLQKDK